MKTVEFILLVYGMGFLTAIPVGATQVEIAKRSLEGYLLPAFMVVLGSVSSDVMYGAIAFFGIARFLQNQTVMVWFWLVSGVLLVILGVLTIRQSGDMDPSSVNVTLLRSKRLSYVTGFSLAVTNPMMILWWLFGLHFLQELHLIGSPDPTVYLTFLLCGGLGLGSYLTTLMLVLHHTKKLISDRTQRRIRFWLGMVLLALAVYFFVRAAQVFLK